MHLKKADISHAVFISTKKGPGSLYSVDFSNNFKDNSNCNALVSKLNFKLSDRCSRVWGSCKGLIMVEATRRTYFLLNPTTSKFHKLPLLSSKYPANRTCTSFGFGYDSSCDDYAVVAILQPHLFKTDACVFVYKTNQWKAVGFSPYNHNVRKPTSGTYVEGSLHWFANTVNDSSLTIASFNIANKEFSEVPLPNGVANSRLSFLEPVVSRGCLCLMTSVIYGKDELWVMKEYGAFESWIKLPFVLTKVSRVVSINLPEDSLLLLEGDCLLLLVSNSKEMSVQCIRAPGLPSGSRFGITFVDSLVSLPNSKYGNKKNRGSR